MCCNQIDINWDAVNAVATTGAVLVALWTAKIPYRRKLSMSVNDCVTIQNLDTNRKERITALNITNTGNVAFHLEQWGVKNEAGQYLVIPTWGTEIPDFEQIDFPKILHSEETLRCCYAFEKILALIEEQVKKKTLSPNKNLMFYVLDSRGKVYFCQSKCKISEMLLMK